MAAAWRHKRVAASQPGFLPLQTSSGPSPSPDGGTNTGRRKRVNKNKKKNWNKYSDINDVEEFLDDVRLQERAAGGLIADKPDDSLFFVDIGDKESVPEPDTVRKKGKFSKPLRIDLILQPHSNVAPPKDILAHQRPNAKKERRKAQTAERLAARGVLPRRQKLRKPAAAASVKEKPVTTKDPDRNFYDLWSSAGPETADPYYLQQTKKTLVKRPEKLNEKPSALPAVEVVAPGASYNPDFFSHQALLLEAHEVEVKKLKAEEKLTRQTAINKADVATQESTFKEQIEGLVEEEEEVQQDVERSGVGAEDEAAGSAAQQEKKTEKQRKKEKAERKKELQKKADRKMIDSRQQLFKLRSIGVELKKREQRTKTRQMQRKAQQEAQKVLPRRLGRLKFQTPDLDVQLSDEIPGSLRTLKPEGSILKDRFKSLQKRNLIEPRERAKFKRKYKLKYVEKRAFKEIK